MLVYSIVKGWVRSKWWNAYKDGIFFLEGVIFCFICFGNIYLDTHKWPHDSWIHAAARLCIQGRPSA